MLHIYARFSHVSNYGIVIHIQLSPKQSPPKAAPPPPPPPPPLMDQSPSSTLYKPVANGDIKNGASEGNLKTPQKLTQAKKTLPTVDDTRNDLLKAIRDGMYSFHIIANIQFHR